MCKHTTKGKKAKPLDVEPNVISIWILDCNVKGLETFNDLLQIGNFCYTASEDKSKIVKIPNLSIIPIENKYKNIIPEPRLA